MPKSPSRSAAKPQEDESHILEKIKRKPELLDSLHQAFTGGRKKQQAQWEELALQFDCTADVLKKVYLKARQNGETKKGTKDSAESRPSSARSSSIEPRETRRSQRLNSVEKTSTASSVVTESTDNSCASSSCGSPRPEDKRPHPAPQPQQQRASRRNLSAISEDDINLAAASATDPTLQQLKEEEEAKSDDVAGQKADQRPDATAEEADQTTSANLTSSASTLVRFLETESKQAHSRFSLPSQQTPRNSQATSTAATVIGSGNPRRLSVSSYNKGAGRMLNKMPNPDDPTRVFFESMGLTVMGFPQHLQASVKVKVSNIVHEMEYELSTPDNGGGDKQAIIAS